MAFGKSKVFASAMQGRLFLNDDTPAAGVRVRRTWRWAWNGESGEDETVTDSNGRFAFATVTGGSLLGSLLPHEPVIEQEYFAYPDSGEILILGLTKRNYDLDGEADGKQLRIKCRTDKEPDGSGYSWGTCVFDG